jgi:hypothetical protein
MLFVASLPRESFPAKNTLGCTNLYSIFIFNFYIQFLYSIKNSYTKWDNTEPSHTTAMVLNIKVLNVLVTRIPKGNMKGMKFWIEQEQGWRTFRYLMLWIFSNRCAQDIHFYDDIKYPCWDIDKAMGARAFGKT